MLKLCSAWLASMLIGLTAHAGGGPSFPLDHAPDRSTDMAALQRGAQLFVNYCLNCHGASMMRYNRLRDIGLTEDQIRDNLLFTADKVGEMMRVNMSAKDAKEWFGATPPDLSVIARARGTDWLYTYMRTFYKDDTRPTGWNNLAFPNVGMPHVLWELQGVRKANFVEVADPHHPGSTTHQFDKLEQVTPGKLSSVDYDNAIADLVAYLQWMGEPQQNFRKQLGVGVMILLLVLLFFATRLNAAYWKDIK
ncbi:cytochrome c1 [Parvibium lacunae]